MKLAKNRPKANTIDVLRREMDQFFDDLVPFSWTRDNGGKTDGILGSKCRYLRR